MRPQIGGKDRGFILVWAALSLVVLLGIAAFPVDFGRLYLEIERSQRAADAAALSGAPFLPSDPEGAKTQAAATLKDNGIDPSRVVYSGPDPKRPGYMKVTLEKSVKTDFARFVGFDTFSFERTGTAAWRRGFGLGSPFNVLGYEPPAAGPSWQNGAGPAIEYFLTQNPSGNPKVNMDRWSAVNCSGGEDGCSGSSNNDYDPNPRLFVVEVDPGVTGTLAVEVYDPGLDILDSGPGVSTNIDLWAPGTNPGTDSPISVGGCTPRSYPTNDPVTSNNWARVCTLSIDGVTTKTGRYVLGVNMPGSQGTEGQNDYSIRAAILQGPPPGGAIDIASTTRVHVYADSKLATHHEPSALLNYYLAKVPSGYAGQTITLNLYDLGETGAATESIKFLDTNIEPAGCQLTVPSRGISLAPTNGLCTFDVSAHWPQFDGTTQKVTIPIDPAYTCVETQATSCWLYLTSPSGAIADEGSSTSIETSGSPLRLFPNS